MCKWGTDVVVMVRIPKELSHTRRSHLRNMKIDSCIAPLIKMLNDYGIETISSCCGHGKTDYSYIRIQPKNITIQKFNNEFSVGLQFPYLGKK